MALNTISRRAFLRFSGSVVAALCACTKKNKKLPFPIIVQNDAQNGHLLFNHNFKNNDPTMHIPTLIVGGGIAGLSAAYTLRGKQFTLCELSNNLGGSSSAGSYKNALFSQGAHYDLEYPTHWGEETLALLEGLSIISYNPKKDSWGFVDKKYLIPTQRESIVFNGESTYQQLLMPGKLKNQFLKLLSRYSGEMVLPSRMIKPKFHFLNQVNFESYLKGKLKLSDDFMRRVDYQMMDDYGAGASEVSALAGIHYYKCRPYYSKELELFSPPEGNFYFAKKMLGELPRERILLSHLVTEIIKINKGFEVRVLNINKRSKLKIITDKIVFAGQKHSLKYIFPSDYKLFSATHYAPWVVINLVLKKNFPWESYWQNETLLKNSRLMGFVDSRAQFLIKNSPFVLTVYFCFPEAERSFLLPVKEKAASLVETTLEMVESYYHRPLSSMIERVYVKIMGHAMPIPGVGYLFKDKNKKRTCRNLVYAGVDNSRLPLLFEAIDSGIMAGKIISE